MQRKYFVTIRYIAMTALILLSLTRQAHAARAAASALSFGLRPLLG
jgi:hypothetical protein